MRAFFDPNFSSWLLKIGDGIENANEKAEVKIPDQINIPFVDDITSLNTLIDMVFPNITECNLDCSFFVK